MNKKCKKHVLVRLKEKKGIWFHIIGFICVVWFALRVLPAPHRSQYPCQQVAIPIALGYISFWSALVFGLIVWMKTMQHKTIAIAPAILVVFILLFNISGMGLAGISYVGSLTYEPWDPIPNDPIGTPAGLYPGRVVWVWNPDATEKDLDGFWWESQNNDYQIIHSMLSQGLQSYTETSSDAEAWDQLFSYFNVNQGNGDQGYSEGETVAIKINLNNCWNPLSYIDDYKTRDNERDAHPDLVKSLLYQLINVVGMAPSDIFVYEASRPMPDWFYDPVSSAYPDVNYVDALGGAAGRIQIQASETYFYFSDGVVRTLPRCVAEAEYLINMPIMKQHPINHGVTLSGKNLFGTFLEPVFDIHPYHESGQVVGNPAPQVDLLASETLGGKTLLYIGDGFYSTLNDHRTIYHFQMEPFFDDWTNSLFISQDPIAIDSVMYDFLHTEGPIPIEGSQNYLHQGADPDASVYDPEDDGDFVEKSIGVHEHWNTEVSVFSSDRYVGPSDNGIDFIAVEEGPSEECKIMIEKPAYHHMYVFDAPQDFSILWKDFYTFPTTVVIGPITVKAVTSPSSASVDYVDFYVDGSLKLRDESSPFEWEWQSVAFGPHVLTVTASVDDEVISSSDRPLIKLF